MRPAAHDDALEGGIVFVKYKTHNCHTQLNRKFTSHKGGPSFHEEETGDAVGELTQTFVKPKYTVNRGSDSDDVDREGGSESEYISQFPDIKRKLSKDNSDRRSSKDEGSNRDDEEDRERRHHRRRDAGRGERRRDRDRDRDR